MIFHSNGFTAEVADKKNGWLGLELYNTDKKEENSHSISCQSQQCREQYSTKAV